MPSCVRTNSFSYRANIDRTINLLFSAQKHHVHSPQQEQQQQQPVLAQPTAPQQSHAQQGSQASLHSFWRLPSSGAASTSSIDLSSPPIDRSVYAPADCEDCGQTIRGAPDGDSMDMDMDMDGFGVGTETSCGSCGKHVCSHCSITNLGEQRRCLMCAGSKAWTGGLGWTTGVRTGLS